MRRRPFHHLTLWLTILTLLWSSLGQGYGYVWCVTADGPTHLESTLESHCDRGAPPLATTEARVALSGVEDAACGPCLDLAATHDTLQQRRLSGSDLNIPFLLLSTILRPTWALPVLVRQLDNNLILEAPPRVATTLLAHRTIVLLI